MDRGQYGSGRTTSSSKTYGEDEIEGVNRTTTKTIRLRRQAAQMTLALALLAGTPNARAQDAPAAAPAEVKDVEKKLESRRNELESTEIRGRELQKSVASIAAEREQINARLLETAALVQKSEAQLTASEARLSQLEAEEKLVRISLAERYTHIAKLLAALQRMGRNPPPVMITRREDALKMVRSAMLLATAFPEMHGQAIELKNKVEQLVRVADDIRTEGERLKAETARLNDMRIRLSGLLETKKQTLAERETELKNVRRAAADIANSVNDLNDLISKLDHEVKKSNEFAAFEKESDRQTGPQAPGGAPAESAAAPDAAAKPTEVAALMPIPAPGAPSSIVELAPGVSLVPGSPGRIKPALPFNLAKAKLPMPAQGRRVLSFGEKTQYGGLSKGLVIETRHNAQVTSPCDGWIVYAGEFRSYGQLLIINAGGGYHVLVAGLSQIDVQPGQFVLAAEPVGTMSGVPRTAQIATQVSAQDSAQTNSPVLYVEFRKDGQPIDPDPWWVAGHQKVQE
jgi:septal ring factor EnvC (AmiA/AmiB activator)